MSKIRLLTIAVIGLLIINLAVLTFLFLRRPAPPGPAGPGRRGETPREIIGRRLELDPGQLQAYDQLIEEHRKSIRELDRQIRDAKNQLYETLRDSTGTGKDSLVAVIGKLHEDIERTHYHHFSGIRSLLRPAQQKEFDVLTGELARFFAPGRPGEIPH